MAFTRFGPRAREIQRHHTFANQVFADRGKRRALLGPFPVDFDFGQYFFNRSGAAGRYLGIYFDKQVYTPPSGSKISLHLAIPFDLFQFVEPLRQPVAFEFREVDDGFHGHTLTIALAGSPCKRESLSKLEEA